MRFSPEADHGGNAGLGWARNMLEPVKAAHPEMSYADLYIFAGKVLLPPLTLWFTRPHLRSPYASRCHFTLVASSLLSEAATAVTQQRFCLFELCLVQVAIEAMGGPDIGFTAGRTDAPKASCAAVELPRLPQTSSTALPQTSSTGDGWQADARFSPDGRLPDGDKGAQHVRDIFYR